MKFYCPICGSARTEIETTEVIQNEDDSIFKIMNIWCLDCMKYSAILEDEDA